MNQTDVAIFMEACGQQVLRSQTTFQQSPETDLYVKLIKEEMQELVDGYEARDLVEVADGAGDLIWVILGLCNAMGFNIVPVWNEICESNMSKIPTGGKVIRREGDGKILKPDSYFPPNIPKALGL